MPALRLARATALSLSLSLALPVGLALTSTPAAAQAPGASASGYAWGDFVIGCTTCPHFLIPLSGSPSQDEGGEGVAVATVQYTGTPVRTPDFEPYTLAGGVSYAATARFTGALMTPLLGAKAAADNEQAFIIVQPDVPVGIDLYTASARARTQMLYQYLGQTPAQYTFHFMVDGQVSNDQSAIYGSAGLYAGPVLDVETGGIAFGSVELAGSGVSTPPTWVSGAFSVALTVNPGESFWLVSELVAQVTMTYSSADVLTDASHTMWISAIDGDTSLLVAMPVPEPAPWMMLTAALALAAVRRRRAAAD
jgi:hypothetical protein